MGGAGLYIHDGAVRIDYEKYDKMSKYIDGGLVSLMLVLYPARVTLNRATRWISMVGTPSALQFKLAIIIYTASALNRKKEA